MKARVGCVVMAMAMTGAMSAAGPSWGAVLANPGFETAGGSGWTYPGTWGSGGSWRDGGAGDAHSGANGATFDALTSLGGDAYYVLHQEIAASEAQEWTVSAWLRTVNLGDENSESWLEVQFWDASDSILAQDQSIHLTSNQDWINLSVSGFIAPANTAKISVRGVVYIDPGGTSQTEFHLFDDFAASYAGEGASEAVPEPSAVGLIAVGTLFVYVRKKRQMKPDREFEQLEKDRKP